MKYLTAAIVVSLISIVAQADEPQEPVFPKFDSQVVTRGASLTWRNYVKWWNKTQGTPLGGDRELAPDLWGEGVAGLKPEYVYTDGVNLVIVRSLQDGDEEGFYVALGISSGPGPNDEQFTRILIAQHAEGTVYAFRRHGHFKRVKAKPEKEATEKETCGGDVR